MSSNSNPMKLLEAQLLAETPPDGQLATSTVETDDSNQKLSTRRAAAALPKIVEKQLVTLCKPPDNHTGTNMSHQISELASGRLKKASAVRERTLKVDGAAANRRSVDNFVEKDLNKSFRCKSKRKSRRREEFRERGSSEVVKQNDEPFHKRRSSRESREEAISSSATSSGVSDRKDVVKSSVDYTTDESFTPIGQLTKRREELLGEYSKWFTAHKKFSSI